MEGIDDVLDRLERRSYGNHHHQTECRRHATPRYTKTKLLLEEMKAANEELGKLLKSVPKKFSHQRIKSCDSALQLEAQPIEENEDNKADLKIFSKEASMVAEELDDPNPFVLVALVFSTEQCGNNVPACDQKIVACKSIDEDVLQVPFVAPSEFPLLEHQSSLQMLWLNDHNNIEVYSQKREAFPIGAILDLITNQRQDEGNDRPRGMSFISILQIGLFDMEPRAMIDVKDENHVFKPGGLG